MQQIFHPHHELDFSWVGFFFKEGCFLLLNVQHLFVWVVQFCSSRECFTNIGRFQFRWWAANLDLWSALTDHWIVRLWKFATPTVTRDMCFKNISKDQWHSRLMSGAYSTFRMQCKTSNQLCHRRRLLNLWIPLKALYSNLT